MCLPSGLTTPPLNRKPEARHQTKQSRGAFPLPRATIYSPPEARLLPPFPNTFQLTSSFSHYARLQIAPSTLGMLKVEF